MSGDNPNDFEKEVEAALASLRTLKDEARVKLHLASMEAKQQWQKFEPQLDELERAAKEVTEATRSAVMEAVERAKAFVGTLK